MSTGFGSYSPWTERQLETERALLARASANMIGEIHERRFDGRLTREAAVELLDILGLAPALPAELQNPGLTTPTAGGCTLEPAEALSAARRCEQCGGPLRENQQRFCGVPCYRQSRLPKCGTRAGANRHRAAGDKPCQPCLEAERAYRRGYRDRVAS